MLILWGLQQAGVCRGAEKARRCPRLLRDLVRALQSNFSHLEKVSRSKICYGSGFRDIHVVCYYADTPCHGNRLSDEEANQGVHFIKIDVDELPELSAELGIRAMPTFMFFKDGQKAQELVGADPATLSKLVQQYRP